MVSKKTGMAMRERELMTPVFFRGQVHGLARRDSVFLEEARGRPGWSDAYRRGRSLLPGR